VATKLPSLLFSPLFIFGNESLRHWKKIYIDYIKYKRTQNLAVLLGDAHPPPMTTYKPHSKKAQIYYMERNPNTVKSKHIILNY